MNAVLRNWVSKLESRFYPFQRFVDLVYAFVMIDDKMKSYGFLRRGREPNEAKFRYRGVDFIARKKDWLAIREVLIEDEYAIVDEILKNIQNPTVLDLGANIGCFAIRILSHFPSANIVSVEASPETFSALQRNAHLSPGQWTALQYAAWREGEAVYLRRANEPISDSVSLTETDEAVPTVSLHSLVRNHMNDKVPQLIKMDIEGAEDVVLTDSVDTLKEVPYLIVELHGHIISDKKILSLLRDIYPACWRLSERSSNNMLILCAKNDVLNRPNEWDYLMSCRSDA